MVRSPDATLVAQASFKRVEPGDNIRQFSLQVCNFCIKRCSITHQLSRRVARQGVDNGIQLTSGCSIRIVNAVRNKHHATFTKKPAHGYRARHDGRIHTKRNTTGIGLTKI
jgi:hypothetical protein